MVGIVLQCPLDDLSCLSMLVVSSQRSSQGNSDANVLWEVIHQFLENGYCLDKLILVDQQKRQPESNIGISRIIE